MGKKSFVPRVRFLRGGETGQFQLPYHHSGARYDCGFVLFYLNSAAHSIHVSRYAAFGGRNSAQSALRPAQVGQSLGSGET